ncbi:menaquinone-specific isochorismate synthase [Pseudomonas sp. ATCC 13867]|nr:menaquinone-specific isochorismate synthase [Pseudomonas sp. ATCC 13867]AGI22683.1 menaquinone-specific isochorismate synthase [Pseudomonas sp. ATCC 13867]RFQ15139.1 hypothetical protein D0N87_27500 [Pseudomonas sp. ATCC 13867]
MALRSPILHERHRHLFAGCGIVENSGPENGDEESEAKRRSIFHALEIES